MGILKVGIKVGKLRLDSYGFGEGQVAGCGKECNEPSGSIKGGKLITFPRKNLLRGFISHMCVCVCVCVRERERERERENGRERGLELDMSQHT
jgi:hypothetical protein